MVGEQLSLFEESKMPTISKPKNVSLEEITLKINHYYDCWYQKRADRAHLENEYSVSKNIKLSLAKSLHNTFQPSLEENMDSADLSNLPVPSSEEEIAQYENNIDSVYKKELNKIKKSVSEFEFNIANCLDNYIHSGSFVLDAVMFAENKGEKAAFAFDNLSSLDKMSLYYLFNKKVPITNTLLSWGNKDEAESYNSERTWQTPYWKKFLKFFPDIHKNLTFGSYCEQGNKGHFVPTFKRYFPEIEDYNRDNIVLLNCSDDSQVVNYYVDTNFCKLDSWNDYYSLGASVRMTERFLDDFLKTDDWMPRHNHRHCSYRYFSTDELTAVVANITKWFVDKGLNDVLKFRLETFDELNDRPLNIGLEKKDHVPFPTFK